MSVFLPPHDMMTLALLWKSGLQFVGLPVLSRAGVSFVQLADGEFKHRYSAFVRKGHSQLKGPISLSESARSYRARIRAKEKESLNQRPGSGSSS